MQNDKTCGCDKTCSCSANHKSECCESVRCEVASCVHNNGCYRCTASQIIVKNRMSILGEETMCETFQEV